MRSKLVTGIVLAVVAVMFVASGAMAAKMLCVSNTTLKGQDTVASCIVHIMTPEEVALTKAFNPKALETRAFGMKFQKEAPIIPMPPAGDQISPSK
jgi:hypothetical protein